MIRLSHLAGATALHLIWGSASCAEGAIQASVDGSAEGLVAQAKADIQPSATVPAETRLRKSPAIPVQPPPPTHATLVVLVSSRNGGELLAQTMAELRSLSAQSEYQDVLRRGDPTEEETKCAVDARSDRSGRVFDLAVCAHAWPALDKAPLAKIFENAYQEAVGSDGMAAFPAVQVGWFEFQKRLRVDQFGGVDEVIDKSEKKAKLTERVIETLCKPNVTFISRDRCQVQLRTRLDVFQPDIYASQVGYRITANRDIPIELADQLRNELLRRVTAKVKPAPDEFRVVAFPKAVAVKSESRRGQLPGTPAQIDKFWGTKGVTPSDLDLADGVAIPPMLLVFDQIDPDSAAMFQGWIQSLRDNRPSVTQGMCTGGTAADAHSKAVGSLLFPEDVESLLRPARPPGTPGQGAANVDGYFLSTPHFSGAQMVDGDRYWLSQGVFRDSDPRIVAVASFSEPARAIQSVASSLAGDLSLDRSRILVVSAAQRSDPPEKSSSTRDYGEAQPTRRAKDFEDACKIGSWPSCLGRHPQVIVVAPSSTTTGVPTLFAEDEYLLGASHVKLAAPGAAIPVLVPCAAASGSTPTWALQALDGTSFAAPLVGLVLTRLIQTGPDKLTDVPELAVWRLLATTDPLTPAKGGTEPTRKVQFGELNAKRALRGASEAEAGSDDAATLYERDDAGVSRDVQAVVAPFLWSDHDQAVLVKSSGVAAKGGIEMQSRGFLTVTPLAEDGTPGKADVLVFRRIVRLAKRANDSVAGRPTFDVYYANWPDDAPDLKTLTVRRRIWLGPVRNDDRGQTGFCRTDGEVQRGEVKSTLAAQSEPACLYAWRKGEKGFVALDLAKVDDIVFPILHSHATWVADISPVELSQVTRSDSPWRNAFCEARPRRAAWSYLERRQKAIDLEIACKGQ